MFWADTRVWTTPGNYVPEVKHSIDLFVGDYCVTTLGLPEKWIGNVIAGISLARLKELHQCFVCYI